MSNDGLLRGTRARTGLRYRRRGYNTAIRLLLRLARHAPGHLLATATVQHHPPSAGEGIRLYGCYTHGVQKGRVGS